MSEAAIAWLILAQTVRWSTLWVTAISWLLFAGVVTAWVRRAGWPRAIRAILGSPLSPIAGAMALSALVNGGWWTRVADWVLYAVMLAWLIDQRPNIDRAIVRVGWAVIGVCLFEWCSLAVLKGAHGWRVHLLGNPNVVAALLAVALPLGRGKLWWCLGLAAMVSTGSLAGIVGMAVYAAVRHRWWCLGLAGLIAFKPQSALLRLAFWQQAISTFAAHPLVGIGPGLYQYMDWIHAHNVVFTLLAETGLV